MTRKKAQLIPNKSHLERSPSVERAGTVPERRPTTIMKTSAMIRITVSAGERPARKARETSRSGVVKSQSM